MPAASEASNERGPRTLIAPRPLSVIPRGLFTINFLVQLLIWKYVVGVPLHRLRKVWASQGANIAAGTLVGTLKPLVEMLEPLYEAIKEVNRREPWWQADETHWKVFIEYLGKVGHRWWLWVFKGPHSTVFILSPTRSAQVPKDHLQPALPLAPEAREAEPLDRDTPPVASPRPGVPSPWWGKRLLTDFLCRLSGDARRDLACLVLGACAPHPRFLQHSPGPDIGRITGGFNPVKPQRTKTKPQQEPSGFGSMAPLPKFPGESITDVADAVLGAAYRNARSVHKARGPILYHRDLEVMAWALSGLCDSAGQPLCGNGIGIGPPHLIAGHQGVCRVGSDRLNVVGREVS